MFTFLTVPGTVTADVMSAAGTLFSDLWTLIAVAVGVPLAFYVIKQVISLVPKSRGRRA